MSTTPDLIAVATARGTYHLTPEQAHARGITVPDTSPEGKKDNGRNERPAPITRTITRKGE